MEELAKWTLGRAHHAEGTARTEALGRGESGWLGREQWGGVQRDEGVGRPRRASWPLEDFYSALNAEPLPGFEQESDPI